MKLLLTEILESPKVFERKFKKSWLENVLSSIESNSFNASSDVAVQVEARSFDLEVQLSGSFSLELQTGCSACLKDFVLEVPVAFSQTMRPKPREMPELPDELELSQQELSESYFEGDTIDIEALIREQILLALPMYPRCSEDCRGLCSGCGADLNNEQCSCKHDDVDPRWAALKSLDK
jgi:uncharacterized protein